MRNTKHLLPFLFLLPFWDEVFSCSAIVLKNKDEICLAKNFDWTFGEGMLMKNLRGASKVAYYTHEGQPAEWTSLYGSITFNQNGKDMPYGGMNEKGLVVEMLWLDQTRYNMHQDRHYVNELEWIQYQLDRYSSVQEVVEHLETLKIFPIKGKIHYILTDTSGASVIIEYLQGSPQVYTKDAATCQAITNHTVTYSAAFRDQIKGIRKDNTAPTYRYYQLEQSIASSDFQSSVSVNTAFDLLRKVTIPKGAFRTMWSIVYDVRKREISWYTSAHTTIKKIRTSDIDFNQGLAFIDIHRALDGVDILPWEVLTEEVNGRYIKASLMHLGFDEKVVQEMGRHQIVPERRNTSLFADGYFHFEITVPMEEERQTGFMAVMDSEAHFEKREAVPGGFLYGSMGRGTLVVHIYGLKNGTYSLLAFIDDNGNRQLDFKKGGGVAEKYTTWGQMPLGGEDDLTFENTSAYFTSQNAKMTLGWR